MSSRLTLPLLALLFVLLPSSARACNVPVFRYALERWTAQRESDRYDLLVFHRGPLAAGDKALTGELLKSVDDNPQAANFTPALLDLGKKIDEDLEALHRELKRPELPLLVVQYPLSSRLKEPAFVGPFTQPAVKEVLHSPARREIARRILGGDSAVWLLLESGDQERDEAAAKLVKGELKRLEKDIKLPELTDDPEDRLKTNAPLKLAFSLLRLSRTNPEEKVLVQMLLHTDPDLRKEKQPMLFPIFGRGRVLDPLIGKGITPRNLGDAATYLAGPCTCKVKELNPGVDLLISEDWEAGLEKQAKVVKDRELPPLTGIAPLALPGLPKGGAADVTSIALVRPIEEPGESPSEVKHNGPAVAWERSAVDSVLRSRLPDCCREPETQPNCCCEQTETQSAEKEGCLICNISIAVGVGLVAVAGLAFFLRRPRRLPG